ncbi:hypothetical protein BJY59DRAFT_697739 [Rhodotorula toruloides]
MAPWTNPFRRNRSVDPGSRQPPPADFSRPRAHPGLAVIANTHMYRDLVEGPSTSGAGPFVPRARTPSDDSHRESGHDTQRTGRSTHRRESLQSYQNPRRLSSNAEALAALEGNSHNKDLEEEHLGVLPSASSDGSFGDWGRSPRNNEGLHPSAHAARRQHWPNLSSPLLPISNDPPRLTLDPQVPFRAHPWEIERHYGLPLRPWTHNNPSIEHLVDAPPDLAYRPPPPPTTFSLQRPPPPRSRSQSPAVFKSQGQERHA